MANMYRDVNLSEVNESYIGKELKVAGWVENIRDHGGVSFIDLRDMYGVLQVVLRDTTLLDGIHKEDIWMYNVSCRSGDRSACTGCFRKFKH